MKITFSIPSKPGSSKRNLLGTSDNCEAIKDIVSEFDAAKSLAEFGKPDVLVIPPKKNEWMPSMKMRNLHLPFSESVGPDIRFDLESSHVPDRGHGSKTSYGLNLRKFNDAANSASTAINVEDECEARIGQSRAASVEVVRLQKLKDDLKRLPEDRGVEEFEKISVEAFGTALLAGYGWHEGRGIGKNAKEDTKVVQFMKRTDKQGIGFRR